MRFAANEPSRRSETPDEVPAPAASETPVRGIAGDWLRPARSGPTEAPPSPESQGRKKEHGYGPWRASRAPGRGEASAAPGKSHDPFAVREPAAALGSVRAPLLEPEVAEAAGVAPPPAAVEPDAVEVEPDDGIASLCGKIDSLVGERAGVVAHRRGAVRLLRNRIALQRLRLHGQRTGKRVGIISRNRSLLRMARRVGLETYSSLKGYRRERQTLQPIVLGAGPLRVRLPRPELQHAAGAVALGVVVLGGLVGAALLVPSAEVVLRPALTPLEPQRLEIFAATTVPEVDPEGVQVPGSRVDTIVEVSLGVETTGTKTIGETAATGVVTIRNRGDVEVVVPAKTPLFAEDGTAFETVEEVTVPAGESAAVEAVAVERGAAGNVEADQVTQIGEELGAQLRVTNEEPFTGGSERQARVVSREDLERLDQLVTEALERRGSAVLLETYSEERFVFAETVEAIVLEKRVDPGLDAEAGVVLMTSRARVRVLTVRQGDVRRLALARLESRQGPDQMVLPDTLDLQLAGVSGLATAGGSLTFTVDVTAATAQRINPEEVKSLVRGKSPEDAAAALAGRFDLAAPPEVHLSPGWFFWLPRFGARITVEVVGR